MCRSKQRGCYRWDLTWWVGAGVAWTSPPTTFPYVLSFDLARYSKVLQSLRTCGACRPQSANGPHRRAVSKKRAGASIPMPKPSHEPCGAAWSTRKEAGWSLAREESVLTKMTTGRVWHSAPYWPLRRYSFCRFLKWEARVQRRQGGRGKKHERKLHVRAAAAATLKTTK